MSETLQYLADRVAANTETQASAIVLLEGLSAALRDAATDPVAIVALADELEASRAALAAAIVANTPAAPAPPTPDDPPAA